MQYELLMVCFSSTVVDVYYQPGMCSVPSWFYSHFAFDSLCICTLTYCHGHRKVGRDNVWMLVLARETLCY